MFQRNGLEAFIVRMEQMRPFHDEAPLIKQATSEATQPLGEYRQGTPIQIRVNELVTPRRPRDELGGVCCASIFVPPVAISEHVAERGDKTRQQNATLYGSDCGRPFLGPAIVNTP